MAKLPSKLWNGMVIVEVFDAKEDTTDSGIVIPESVNAALSEGVVIRVAEDAKDDYAEGDIVLYPSGAGNGQFINGKTCIWINKSKIWATL
jgi:co-chaperonin GroES (HSP10)